LAKVARLPCVACAVHQGVRRFGVHVAHIRIGYPNEPGWREVGKAEKPSDHRSVPLCPAHHMDGPDAQHRMSEAAFWHGLGIHPPDFCRALVEAFAAGDNGRAVVDKFAAIARSVVAARSRG
jgi:hypothetical protein